MIFRFVPSLPFLLAALFLPHPPSLLADEFKAGAAQVDITPPLGTPMAGFYSTRPSAGVLDPIHAKSIVIEQDGEKAALVAVDLAFITRSVVVAARKLIAEQTGIAAERVMISATHTHSGPVLNQQTTVSDDITGANTPLALDYTGKLPALIARTVSEANAKLAPARSSTALGREEHVSFNRRYKMKDGSVSWMGPKLKPNVVGPAGPIDPDVGVWHLSREGEEAVPLVTFVNFAMHPTVINGLKISPDYPGYLAKRLADYQGAEALTFFANGCCGNINQRDINWADTQNGPREAERIGTVLAAAVFRAWPQLQPLKTFAPRTRSTLVTLARPTYSEKEIEEARGIARRMFGQTRDPKLDIPTMAKATRVLDTIANRDVPLEAEVQVIALGDDLAIVALPGEMFVELGLAIKKVSPFKHTFIAELANGYIGYVPNCAAYAEGQYEVVSARCAEGGGERLVEEAVKLLRGIANP
jgi:neutral ceramidase